MTKEQQQVKEFMIKAGQATPEKPIIPDAKTRILRVKLLLEEVLELAEASGVGLMVKSNSEGKLSLDNLWYAYDDNKVDLVGVADALTDIDYVNLGAACAYGLDLAPFQDEVQKANMAKFGPGGYRREDGKWMKPPDWQEPDIKSELERQVNS